MNQNIQIVEICRHVSADVPVTWDLLCGVSPELRVIRDDAISALGGERDKYFWSRYESLKRRMKSCVGWDAHPGLPDFVLTSDAYDLAFKEIFGRWI